MTYSFAYDNRLYSAIDLRDRGIQSEIQKGGVTCSSHALESTSMCWSYFYVFPAIGIVLLINMAS